MQCRADNGNACGRRFNPDLIALAAEALGSRRHSPSWKIDIAYLQQVSHGGKACCNHRTVILLRARWMTEMRRGACSKRLACHHWDQRKFARRAGAYAPTLRDFGIVDVTRLAG